MLRIAHIINPVKVPTTSDLHVAQPITFASMLAAQAYAKGRVDVRLLTTQFPEDHEIIPEGIEKLPDLERSVLDLGPFEKQRKLPVLGDILQRLAEAAPDADYCIYSNADIGVQPYFYTAVARLVDQGVDGCSITRRTVSDELQHVEDLPQIYEFAGEQHPGHDCFVFSRKALDQFFMANTILGARYVGNALLLNVFAASKKFRVFKRFHLTFHLGNDRRWSESAYDEFWNHNAREVAGVVKHFRKEDPCQSPQFLNRLERLERRVNMQLTGGGDVDGDELDG